MADKHHIAIGNDLAEVVRLRDFVVSVGAVLQVSDATVEKLILGPGGTRQQRREIRP